MAAATDSCAASVAVSVMGINCFLLALISVNYYVTLSTSKDRAVPCRAESCTAESWRFPVNYKDYYHTSRLRDIITYMPPILEAGWNLATWQQKSGNSKTIRQTLMKLDPNIVMITLEMISSF